MTPFERHPMRTSFATTIAVLSLAGCDDSSSTDLAVNVGNPGSCDHFQSPREVGSFATYSTSSTAGLGVQNGPGARQVTITIPADAYGRAARTMTLDQCDEHFHNPIEHQGACEVPVGCGGDGMCPPGGDEPTVTVAQTRHLTAAADAEQHGPPPQPGDAIELHTAYSETVDMRATGLARCKGVAFVRASQWIVSADEPSDPLAFADVARYAGSTTGGGGQACKPPAWWEVVLHCHVMSKNDPRLAGHAHPARPLQTYLSPMKKLIVL